MPTGWEPCLCLRPWKRSIPGATGSRRSMKGPSCARPASHAPCSCSCRDTRDCSTSSTASGSRRCWATRRRSPSGPRAASALFTWRSTPGWAARASGGTRSTRCATPRTRRTSRAATPSSTPPTGDGSVEEQLARFERAVARLKRRPALLHVANSAAALTDRRFAFDLVRPGVFLYGGSPGEGFPEPRAVVSVRARVVAVRRVAAGESVSYNARWRATRGTTVATLGIGYADGVRRAVGLSGRGAALLGGRRCPIVGAVTMDLTMVETGDHPVQVGDVATLLGEAKPGGRITLDELATWSGELQRAVLTSFGPRLPRIYD